MADIVEPKGAKYKLPLPLLSQHDHHLPIGWVKSATVTDNGIEIDGEVAEQAGLDYVETAWKQLKAGLVRGLSIGFSPIKYKWIQDDKGNETGGIHFEEWDWLELARSRFPQTPSVLFPLSNPTTKTQSSGLKWSMLCLSVTPVLIKPWNASSAPRPH